MTRVIGIDPGVQGAIAWTDDGRTYRWERLYPRTARARDLDIDHPARRVRELVDEVRGDAVVYLEEVITLSHDARSTVLAASRRWGDLHRACRDSGAAEVHTVMPHVWMSRLVGKLPRKKAARKNVLAAWARRFVGLPPASRRLPVYMADGVLVCVYGVRDWRVRGAMREAQGVGDV